MNKLILVLSLILTIALAKNFTPVANFTAADLENESGFIVPYPKPWYLVTAFDTTGTNWSNVACASTVFGRLNSSSHFSEFTQYLDSQSGWQEHNRTLYATGNNSALLYSDANLTDLVYTVTDYSENGSTLILALGQPSQENVQVFVFNDSPSNENYDLTEWLEHYGLNPISGVNYFENIFSACEEPILVQNLTHFNDTNKLIGEWNIVAVLDHGDNSSNGTFSWNDTHCATVQFAHNESNNLYSATFGINNEDFGTWLFVNDPKYHFVFYGDWLGSDSEDEYAQLQVLDWDSDGNFILVDALPSVSILISQNATVANETLDWFIDTTADVAFLPNLKVMSHHNCSSMISY